MTKKELDQLAINTIRTLSHRRRPAGEVGVIRHAHGLWHRLTGLYLVEPGHALRSEGSDLARSRTASSCRTAMPRCCCGPSCISRHPGSQRRVRTPWASRRSRSTTSATSASSTARRRGTRNITGCPASRRTTGPLGQGIATSVGMAIARRWLASRYNRPGFDMFDYDIYRSLRRWLPDGRHRFGGGLAGRPSPARRPVLDLR